VGIGRTIQVTVIGRGDSTGTEDVNRAISRRRAERVARALALDNARAVTFVVRGVGSSEPLRREVTEEDRELNRSVTLALAVAGGTPAGSR
jgi:outer membrane protein OmpA-like peptidoglycan-associated protein